MSHFRPSAMGRQHLSLKFTVRPGIVTGSLGNGRVPEWSIGLAWKACVLQKGTEGSNPSPSASAQQCHCRIDAKCIGESGDSCIMQDWKGLPHAAGRL